MYNPTSIKVAAAAPAAPAPAAPGAEAPAAEAAAPAAQPGVKNLTQYWKVISDWGNAIREGTSPVEDIPANVKDAIAARYLGEEKEREKSWLIMISWLYEHIQATAEYTAEQKQTFRTALAKTLIEFIWDESLRANEQHFLVSSKNPSAVEAAGEQIVRLGGREAFRIIDPITGKLRYFCGDKGCSVAMTQEFEGNPDDPINTIKANTDTTGQIYGFVVPKAKERRLVFKTSSAPPAPGGVVEKGGECAIVSTISYHIKMLKEISELLVAEGYPRFILVDEILDEKARKKREKEEAKAAGRKVVTAAKPARTFENAVRACALKNIMLRWMTIMQEAKGAGAKRYFYRPIAAAKSGHKGAVSKMGAA
jgi:hypothetical protein